MQNEQSARIEPLLPDAWDEATVLRVCAHLERTGIASVPRPEVRADVLGAR